MARYLQRRGRSKNGRTQTGSDKFPDFMKIKRIALLLTAALSFCCGNSASAQNEGYDVFIPIAKYIRQGDAERLSAWFDDNLEISVTSTTSDSSKNQAKQILKAFFSNYTPRSFDITHTAGRTNMKYAVGKLVAGGETFEVTIFVSFKVDSYKIQQLKILREK